MTGFLLEIRKVGCMPIPVIPTKSDGLVAHWLRNQSFGHAGPPPLARKFSAMLHGSE